MNPYSSKCPRCGERTVMESAFLALVTYSCKNCYTRWVNAQELLLREQFETLERIDSAMALENVEQIYLRAIKEDRVHPAPTLQPNGLYR